MSMTGKASATPSHPCITIGLTAWNAAKTIERAVLSATAQDWTDTDIVVVNDASTDNTADILRQLSTQYPTLRVYTFEKNSGVAAARNKIIQEAQGEFIAFFDDDDESDLKRLLRQFERITAYEKKFANNAPVICHTARTQIYPDGKRRYEPTMGTIEDVPAPRGTAVAERILTGKPVPHVFGSTATCSQMARTSVYRALNGFDETFRRGEDTDFNVRAALAGAHFVGISLPLVTQYMTLTSDKKLDEELFYYLRLLEKHKTFVRQAASYPFCHDWISAKHDLLAGRKSLFLYKLIKIFLKYPLHTIRRLYWALPNCGSILKVMSFHHE